MKRWCTGFLRASSAVVLSFCLAAAAAAQGVVLERVSVSATGGQGDERSGVNQLSGDGRLVAFSSMANNLVPNDQNYQSDGFIKDRLTGAIELVTVSGTGAQANHASGCAGMSDDGRFVVLSSLADNLVPGDTNGNWDLFLRDRAAGTTRLLSVSTSGGPGNAQTTGGAITPDGRYVAFTSLASDLVADDTNGVEDVFVFDTQTNVLERVSLSGAGEQGNDFSLYPAISDDGRFVAFSSRAGNLVPGDTNNSIDTFVRDRLNGTTERVSVSSTGQQGYGAYYSSTVAPCDISADGRFVAFQSRHFLAGDNADEDVFLRDRQLGTTELVSRSSAGVPGNGQSGAPVISRDGRYVAYNARSTNLVPNDTNGLRTDSFVFDRLTGKTTLVSLDGNGNQVGDDVWIYDFSGDARQVALVTWAALLPGDTNGWSDVYIRARVLDQDADGYDETVDCNDGNPSVFPGAPELCDGIDNNCDGRADEGLDADLDGWTTCGGDCNDANAAVHPGAAELCDGIDNDCNARIDDGFATLEVCAAGCAYATIQSAIDVAANCETVLVQPGTYLENVNLGLKKITLRGASGAAATVIDGSAPADPARASVVTFGIGVTAASRIEGFTIRGGRGTLDGTPRLGAGIYAPGGSPVIRDCVITGNTADLGSGDNVSAGGGVYAGAPTIENCTITYNWAHAAGGGIHASAPLVSNSLIADNYANWGSGLYIYGGTVRNSVIRHNGWGGPEGWAGGIQISGPAAITNCLIAENYAGQGSGIRVFQSSPTITNCTIAQNGMAVIFASPRFVNSQLWGSGFYFYGTSSVAMSYSNIQGGWAGEGNTSQDPRYVDPANGDYRLGDSSPARDAGTPVGAPADDLLGTARPQGAGIDIGAYEWHDGDGDGYGDATDCDDADAAINPGAAELCDSIDNNCNGQVDEGFDADHDGWTVCGGDCDDVSASVFPGAAEVCNRLDDNCNGLTDSDDPALELLITAGAGSGGSIDPSGTIRATCFQPQAFTITPNAGHHVADVVVDGASVGAVSSYTFADVVGSHVISAAFAINRYALTPTAGANGTISPAAPVTVDHGGSQTFSMTPNVGYHVADVVVDGVSVGPVTSYTFADVDAAHAIVATFAINRYTLTPTAGANGSITPATPVTVDHGGSQTFTIAPNTNYRIADVTVDGVSVGAVPSYTFSNAAASHSIRATFAAFTAVTVLAPNGGEVIASGSTSVIKWGAPATAVRFDLAYSTNNGVSYTNIATNRTGYSYAWTVPTPAANSPQCRVRVIGKTSAGATVGTDASDGAFTIEVVRVVAPNGGEAFRRSVTPQATIAWITNGTSQAVNRVVLSYSTNGGGSWTTIATLSSNPGSYAWTLPAISSSQCRVRVSVQRNNGVLGSDTSDANFSVAP